ncbi:hypothetical protein HMPREF0185_01484 [Brevundimonas diminuta 470-4]|nr:hypothetical protein HMPREF0185_01484 [Brevundimonas diminuta 470-4]
MDAGLPGAWTLTPPFPKKQRSLRQFNDNGSAPLRPPPRPCRPSC